jgi:predicted nucleotidyltransferase
MKASQLGGLARSKALTPRQRKLIAQKAARARWSPQNRGLVTRAEIKKQLDFALAGRDAHAYLFGSYARGDATPRSDIDLLIVDNTMTNGWLQETMIIRRRLNFDKEIDLIVIGKSDFDTWKHEYGTVQHEAFREGVRLV